MKKMKFFGLLTFIVLPLFLYVCISMLRQSSIKDTFLAKILEVIFTIFIVLAVIGIGLILFNL
jgi:hypothetical protein